MVPSATALTLSFPPPYTARPPTTSPAFLFYLSSLKFNPIPFQFLPIKAPTRPSFVPKADDGDADGGGPDDYDMDDEEVEELDNKKDYDVEYDPLAATGESDANGEEDIAMVDSKSFVSTQGWESEKIVDYRIDEEEFHKISLLDCDFFIRKPPDPDNDVYDFREMYVTPPDTDVYAIPTVLAPMPQKYIRCAKSDYGWYNVTEPPIDAPRDPMYKSEKEVSKVTVSGGRNRDRKRDLLVIRDNGASFKIIDTGKREYPDVVLQREEWAKSRQEMEKHLSKLRDFGISNWF